MTHWLKKKKDFDVLKFRSAVFCFYCRYLIFISRHEVWKIISASSRKKRVSVTN